MSTWRCSINRIGGSSFTTKSTSLPAPVFRATADIQSRRRLGLTATLLREDAKEREVFTRNASTFRAVK
jgi:hypothetical protein